MEDEYMIKRFLAVMLALCLLAAASVSLAESDAAAASPAAPTLLVTVNGEEIRDDDIYLSIWQDSLQSQVSNNGGDPSDPETQLLINQHALDYTIQFYVMRQELARLGNSVTPEDIAANEPAAHAAWESIISNFMSEMGITEESTEEEKAAARADALNTLESVYGYTEDLYVQSEAYYFEVEEVLERIHAITSPGVTATDEDVTAYYQDLVKNDQDLFEGNAFTYEYYTNYYGYESMYIPEGYRGVTHILLSVDDDLLQNWKDLSARLEEASDTADEAPAETPAETSAEETAAPEPTEEPVTQEMVDAAKQAILDSVQPVVDEILAKLDAGTDFDELIKEYGTDPGMENDENRLNGYPVHADSIIYDPVFTEAAMALEKVGDISEPVVTQFGVHLLHYLRDIPGGAVELTDEMKAELLPVVQAEAENNALAAHIDELLAASTLEWSDAGEDWKLDPAAEAEEAGIPAE